VHINPKNENVGKFLPAGLDVNCQATFDVRVFHVPDLCTTAEDPFGKLVFDAQIKTSARLKNIRISSLGRSVMRKFETFLNRTRLIHLCRYGATSEIIYSTGKPFNLPHFAAISFFIAACNWSATTPTHTHKALAWHIHEMVRKVADPYDPRVPYKRYVEPAVAEVEEAGKGDEEEDQSGCL